MYWMRKDVDCGVLDGVGRAGRTYVLSFSAPCCIVSHGQTCLSPTAGCYSAPKRVFPLRGIYGNCKIPHFHKKNWVSLVRGSSYYRKPHCLTFQNSFFSIWKGNVVSIACCGFDNAKIRCIDITFGDSVNRYQLDGMSKFPKKVSLNLYLE